LRFSQDAMLDWDGAAAASEERGAFAAKSQNQAEKQRMTAVCPPQILHEDPEFHFTRISDRKGTSRS